MGYYDKSKVKITKPCPICRSKKIHVKWYAKYGDHWTTDVCEGWIYCGNCGCRTDTQSGLSADDYAKKEWNKGDTWIDDSDLKKWKNKNLMRRLKKENKRLKLLGGIG